MATPAQIKKIHVLIKKIPLSVDDYHAMLDGYGVMSSTDQKFTFQKAKNMIQRLYKMQRPGMATEAQKRMLWSMWLQVTKADGEAKQLSAFKTFIRNRWCIDDLKWLPDSVVPKIKKALEAMGANYGH